MIKAIIGKDFPRQVIPLIDSAKHSIRIVVFDWRWYKDDPANPCQLFNNAMVRASRRGVAVRACVNSDTIKNPLVENGIAVRIPVSSRLMHTKMILIDNSILILGSHNFSQSAFTQNFETSVIIDSAEDIVPFSIFFESLWTL